MFHLIHCTGTDGQQSGGNLPKKLDPCSYQTNKTQLRVAAKGNFIASSEQHAGGCT